MTTPNINAHEIGKARLDLDWIYSTTGANTYDPDITNSVDPLVVDASTWRYWHFTLPTNALVFTDFWSPAWDYMEAIVLQNLDDTNFLEVKWGDLEGTIYEQTTAVLAGDFLILTKIQWLTVRADTGGIELKFACLASV